MLRLLIVFILLGNGVFAQNDTVVSLPPPPKELNIEEELVYFPEVEAEFPGGVVAMHLFL